LDDFVLFDSLNVDENLCQQIRYPWMEFLDSMNDEEDEWRSEEKETCLNLRKQKL
jgi:hypothetical protein